jgi:hypothetical protein
MVDLFTEFFTAAAVLAGVHLKKSFIPPALSNIFCRHAADSD